jgi:hypothetical protein
LFAYLVSNESHFLLGQVTTWDWNRGDDDPMIRKLSASFNTALSRKPDKDQIRLNGGRVASVGKNNQ